jgi:MFS family permease
MGKLAVLLTTAFVDMIGLLAILPLLPFYAAEFGTRGFALGLLVSSVAVAQMLAAPAWGRLSDGYGRRPAVLGGLAVAGIGYLVFAFADSFWLLLLSQVIQGAGGGTLGVVQAYVADTMEPEDRARGLGWLTVATNAGVVIGPVLGSLALTLGRSAPGLLSAALCAVNLVFAWRFLGESHQATPAEFTSAEIQPLRQTVLRVVTHSMEAAPRLIWMYAIAMGASLGMTSILALFLVERFQVTEKTIGWFFVYIGAISVFARAFVLGWMVDRLGEVRLCRLGSAMLAAGLAGMPFAHDYLALAIAVALVPFGTAFTFPCVTALLSRVISNRERGLYMGVQQTFGGMALVLGPIWAGFAYDHLGRGVPFWTSSLLVLGTIVLGLGLEPGSCNATAATDQHPAAENARR